MELLRTIAYPPGGGSAKGCEAALGRAAGGESRRKKAEEQPHQHAHPAAEVSRIITDPTTGKRYCRGKVLGKVIAMAGPLPSRGGGRCAACPLRRSAVRSAGAGCVRRALFLRGCFRPGDAGVRRTAAPHLVPQPDRSPICPWAAPIQTRCHRALFLSPDSYLPLNTSGIAPLARESLRKGLRCCMRGGGELQRALDAR